jgi:hypothetical protein
MIFISANTDLNKYQIGIESMILKKVKLDQLNCFNTKDY